MSDDGPIELLGDGNRLEAVGGNYHVDLGILEGSNFVGGDSDERDGRITLGVGIGNGHVPINIVLELEDGTKLDVLGRMPFDEVELLYERIPRLIEASGGEVDFDD